MAERPTEIMDRLLDWKGRHQFDSQSLATKIMAAEGYTDIDPIHPLGGPDGGKDALMSRKGKRWVMACWFPNGKQSFSKIKKKLTADFAGVASNRAHGLVFVTNQEVKDAERDALRNTVTGKVKLYHLHRIADILDRPENLRTVQRYLHIGPPPEELSMINRTQQLSNQLLEFADLMSQVSAVFFPDQHWTRQSKYLADRITHLRESDMRVRDDILAQTLLQVRCKWYELNRIFILRSRPPDWQKEDFETFLMPIKQFRYAHNIRVLANYARERIIEVTNEPWRLNLDETELFDPQIWDEDELPSTLRESGSL